MDASRDDKCHKEADEHTGQQRGTTINIQVALLGGQSLSFETHLSATVSDIKALIHEQLGHHPSVQTLILDTTILAESSALLKDVAVNDGSLLSLTFSDEPLGQSLLTEPDGKMEELNRQGTPDKVLNEFQLMSLQAAWKSWNDPNEALDNPWGNLGAWGMDLHWTTRSTRSNKRRYEYWSTAPGDNERGALVRIDADSVTCIGSGSDDGLCVFRIFQNDRVAMKLVREGWPCSYALKEYLGEYVEEANEDFDHSEAENEAKKAIKAMKKLTPAAKKKAMKKLPLHVQVKVAVAMKASASTVAGSGVFEATPGGGLFGAAPAATGGGLFGAPLATTGNGLFGEAPSTTAGGLFGETGIGLVGAATATTGGGLFGAASVTTGGGLFGDAMTGGGLFGAPAATGGGPCSAPLATTGDGLFGAAPSTTVGGLFGEAGSGLFGAATATSGGGLFGAASVTTGGGLFGDAMTGGGLFGAPATTVGGPCRASLATTGDGLGLFDAAPATTAGGIFGSGGLFGATLVTTHGDLFGAATATTSGGVLGAASATTGGGLFGDAPTGGLFGEALATTGSGHFGAAPVATGASSSFSSQVETSSKKDECKTQ